MTLDQLDREVLEAIIDRTNLSSVLEALGEICGDKADHLQANWQEKATSPHVRHWHVVSNKLDTLARAVQLGELDLKIYRGAL